MKSMNKHRKDGNPLQPSSLARVEADKFFPGIDNTTLRVMAQRVLDRAKLILPLPNRASCFAVIRGITGTAGKKGSHGQQSRQHDARTRSATAGTWAGA